MKQEIQKIKDLVNKISAVVIKPNRDTFAINTYICIKSISPEVKQLQDEVSNLEKLYNSTHPQESTSKQKDSPSKDKVNHPSHYSYLKELCGVEVIDITRHMDFDTGNALKYLLRAGHKSEQGYDNTTKAIEDLQKAIFYIKDKINMLLIKQKQ